MALAEPAVIAGYHAHIYYDDASRPVASILRGAIEQRFDVVMGRWRDEPVGPHPQAMYQVAFAPGLFDELVPWLMLNHAGLVVLIHPRSGDDLFDHSEAALWLGNKLDLDLSVL
jgi:aromatic ring-cleaving dioxygenase